MKRSRVSRRQLLLAALGLGGAAMYLPSLSRPSHAGPAVPKRLLLFYTEHGNPYPGWSMRQPGLPETMDWEFDLSALGQSDFSASMQPLWPFRNKLLFLDSLSNAANLGQSSPQGHFGGPATIFTSSAYDVSGSNPAASAPSLDQIVADHVAVPGLIRSIEMGTDSGAAIWQGAGAKLPVRQDPSDVFDLVFPSGSAPSQGPPTREELIGQARAGVVERAEAEFSALLPSLSGEDRVRLEAHRDMLHELRLQMQTLGSVECVAPAGITQGPSSPLAERMAAFAKVTAAAFACDLTRVASVQMKQLSTSDFGAPPGDVHQDYAHHGPGNAQWMTEYYNVHAKHLASFLGELDAIVEPDGTTVLDNTVVLWAPECGSWVHQTSHLPLVLAGGGGFKMGRYLYWTRQHVVPDGGIGGNVGKGYGLSALGPPHSRLLVSIANRFGLAVDQIGTMATATDSLGQSVDLRGELPRLM